MKPKYINPIIPDDRLQEYLADKLLVKPDYTSDPERAVDNRYQEAVKAQQQERQDNNKRVKRWYGL